MSKTSLVHLTVLYIPVISSVILLYGIRDTRRRAGLFLSGLWAFCSILALNKFAVSFDWWSFGHHDVTLGGIPLSLLIGWAAVWGVIAPIVAQKLSLFVVATIALWLDVAVMPALEPIVLLNDNWLKGEFIGLFLCLLPALLLYKWTANDESLLGRTILQTILFSMLLFFVLPLLEMQQTGTNFDRLRERSDVAISVAFQLLAIPALVAIISVVEFVKRGEGTPFPWDAPRRLVTSGPYAYVSNPMQLSATLMLVGYGVLLSHNWLAIAGVSAVMFSSGIAKWHESRSLNSRFGNDWTSFRSTVRSWIPRWKPTSKIPFASLFIAETCGPCSQIGRWFVVRDPKNLTVESAENFQGDPLRRVTYESDGMNVKGVAAIGYALEHLSLPWALVGWFLRFPGWTKFLQLLVDASGGGPREIPKRDRTKSIS